VNSRNPSSANAASADVRGASFRVLGIDPAAVGPTGYGVIESYGPGCRLVHYGALRITAKRQQESLGAGLQEVHALLCKLIAEYSPQALAVEGIFSALNVRTALRLAEVRGVVLLAAAQHNVSVHSYSPREVKASVAGYGNADKRQMQVMVRALLQMTETPEPADAADALAVALCHMQVQQMRVRYALPEGKTSARAVSGRRNAEAELNTSGGTSAGIRTATRKSTSLESPTAIASPMAASPAAPRIVIHR
jgi:crossover junction endodeoxyribonuclease RuvC